MKVYINRQPRSGAWGGGNLFVSAFHKRAPKLCELQLGNAMQVIPDVILLAGLDNDGTGMSAEQAIMYKLYMKPDCRIVVRVNENDARKGTRYMDDMLLKVSAHIDGTVFVSDWLQQYFVDKGWACAERTVVRNGVAADVFAPQPKTNNGKLNVVAHHWSDNPMKGQDVYEELDKLVGEQPDRFAFTYIGRTQARFKHSTLIKPLAGKALGDELGKHDVYVSASRFDPGPNHVLEALSCGLSTWVHQDGGGAVEFAGADHSYSNWGHLQEILQAPNPTAPNAHGLQLQSWQSCVEQYVAFLDKVHKLPIPA